MQFVSEVAYVPRIVELYRFRASRFMQARFLASSPTASSTMASSSESRSFRDSSSSTRGMHNLNAPRPSFPVFSRESPITMPGGACPVTQGREDPRHSYFGFSWLIPRVDERPPASEVFRADVF